MYTQASKIINRFGGARALTAALKQIGIEKSPSTIYRWAYPKTRGGTNGLIPNFDMEYVIKAAAAVGIFLTDDDMRIEKVQNLDPLS